MVFLDRGGGEGLADSGVWIQGIGHVGDDVMCGTLGVGVEAHEPGEVVGQAGNEGGEGVVHAWDVDDLAALYVPIQATRWPRWPSVRPRAIATRVVGWDAEDACWADIGTHDRVAAAREAWG